MQGINIRTKSREAALTDLIKKIIYLFESFELYNTIPKKFCACNFIFAQIDTKR